MITAVGAFPFSTQLTIAPKKIELIETRASAAVPHSWNEIELAPPGNGFQAAIRSRHLLVVLECVERREPGIAVAVVKDQLAAMPGKVVRLVDIESTSG